MTTCVAVESYTHVDWDIESRTFWIDCATTSKVVHPATAATEVVGVVVFASGVVIYAIRNTCILQPVACAFYIAWIATGSGKCLIGNV